MKGLDMFPEINPNIDEIIRQQDAIDPEEVAVDTEEVKPKTKENDIFLRRERVKGTKSRSSNGNDNKQNLNSPTLTIIEEDLDTPLKKNNKLVELSDDATIEKSPGTKTKRYSHLAKARQKGLEKRRANAAAKKELKELKKAEKEEEKRLRREATKERNRAKARDRYRRIKAEKETETEPIDIPKPKPQKPKGMSYDTFSKYMDEYQRQNTIKNKKIEKPRAIIKPKPVVKPYHPKNYPLAHIYNKTRNRTFF